MSCSVTYLLTGSGWAECLIGTDGSEIRLLASYLHDTLDELLRAAASIVHGALEARALFIDEPGECRLIIEHTDEDRLRLRVLAFEKSFSGLRDADGRLIFAAECRLRTFAGAVLSAAQRLLRDHGPDGYRALWKNHDFPMRSADDLKNALRLPDS